MLRLKEIIKNYKVGDQTVRALRGVSVDFRRSEFVSVLGPSGCGKTTLLNIIGGLDQYTSGDLVINGKSTKTYKDADWDSYRNHSVGFVFQGYNLIPHQSVLSNVELALTLSGVSKAERRERATAALTSVGLGDQLRKKPNQLSGGQMQRVAIARALVNNPDILLADEPTGALDSETSVQIMEILKEISKDKLIIMVTHNPELAERYSNRIIRLLDGEITDDSNPYTAPESQPVKLNKRAQRAARRANKKKSMSFLTALSLSFNNLLTKKTRTFMTSFAGSIGIIGISLILALSSGVNSYIQRVEEETLSSYPIQIAETSVDISGMMSGMMGNSETADDHELDKIYSNNIMTDMINSMVSEINTNDLEQFKKYLEDDDPLGEYISDIKYSYKTQLNIYSADTANGVKQVNPSDVFERLGFQSASNPMMSAAGGNAMSNTDIWEELIGNDRLLSSQYDIVAGSMPEADNEVVLIVDKNNEISDYTLYSLGVLDIEELESMIQDIADGKDVSTKQTSYSYKQLLELKFKLLVNTDLYDKADGVWVDRSEDAEYMEQVVNAAETISVVGILRPNANSTTDQAGGIVGYRSGLMSHLIGKVNESEIVREQQENEDTDIFTGRPFKTEENTDTADFDISTLPAEQQQYLATLSEDEQKKLIDRYIAASVSDATYEGNLGLLGVSDLAKPSGINIYPKDFEAKEKISALIDDYNDSHDEAEQISYTDYIGLLMSSVTTIINAISYILIAFVAISLVVSSIMIGIITYISVLERTKEIGVLRSVGASKRDISRVFNAETLIVGFVAGALGILVTLLLLIPINAIIGVITGISGLAVLPAIGGGVLVLISMFLTFIAGLIPAKIAAKKDPVEALRTE